MPSIKNKAYEMLLSLLSQLVYESRKHSSNPKITMNVNIEELQTVKTDLEFLRRDYIQKEKQARTAYKKFNEKFKISQRIVSNECRIIKGILDPNAEELHDFGIVPEKPKARKKRIYEL
jgi:hypothetical protein